MQNSQLENFQIARFSIKCIKALKPQNIWNIAQTIGKRKKPDKLQTKSSNETQRPKNIIPTFKGWLMMPQGITKGNERGKRMCIEKGRGKTGQNHEVETTAEPCIF